MLPATSISKEPVFPASCPNCGEPAGLPYVAATSCVDDRIRVGLRCGSCAHEWRVKMPIVKPKLDRRAVARGH